MAKLHKYKELSDADLSLVSGGNKQEGNIFLGGVAGATEGILYCASNGAIVIPSAYLACAGVGALIGIFLPH